MRIRMITGEYDPSELKAMLMVELIHDEIIKYPEELRGEVYSRLIEKVEKEW